MPISNPTGGNCKVTNGTYAGNDGTNRAIAHSLGVTPRLVVINNDNQTVQGIMQAGNLSSIMYLLVGGNSGVTIVTYGTATYFYVGDGGADHQSFNRTGQTYYWTAFAPA